MDICFINFTEQTEYARDKIITEDIQGAIEITNKYLQEKAKIKPELHQLFQNTKKFFEIHYGKRENRTETESPQIDMQ